VYQLVEQVHQIAQASQVAIFVVSYHPWILVVDFYTIGKRVGFGEVNHPYVGLGVVVDE